MKPGHTSVLLVNLGTPEKAETSAVRTYLKEFLMDPRVIDIPRIQRNLLVRLIIAPFRSGKSAKAYQQIWTNQGSPLMVHTHNLAHELNAVLPENYEVHYAMRYGQPSIPSVLNHIRKGLPSEIIVIPLYPQYASASTGSVHEKIMDCVKGWETIPEISFVNSYFDDEGLAEAFADEGNKHDLDSFDHILFSFHGLPERQLRKSDEAGKCLLSKTCCFQLTNHNRHCYGAQSYATARAISKKLNLSETAYSVSFQSRLGRAEWKKPYTSSVLPDLARKGKKRVLVFCPSFVSDCLETLYEIGIEYKELFRKSGGEELVLVNGLNVNPKWVETLARIARRGEPKPVVIATTDI